jgi:hypothetical protein
MPVRQAPTPQSLTTAASCSIFHNTEIDVRVVAVPGRNSGLVAIVLVIAAVLAIGVAIRASGMRPYGEQAILRQIDQEDGALCQKFGFLVTAPQFADCMLALADLRQRHVELLVAYSWL